MAYMNQEKKANLAPAIKAYLKKFGVKGSLRVRNHSTLVLTLSKGALDLMGNHNACTAHEVRDYVQVNEYHLETEFTGTALAFMRGIKALMMVNNHDRSDIQSDYFDVGWYIDISVGQYNKPYEVVT